MLFTIAMTIMARITIQSCIQISSTAGHRRAFPEFILYLIKTPNSR